MRRPKPVYPPTWPTFSHYIRFVRAGGQCECMGQCSLHCTHPGPRRCVEVHGQPGLWQRGTHGLIQLSTAHLCDCDPPCVEEAHVIATCARCHILIDRPLHAKHIAETRRWTKEALGQLSFLP